VSTSHEREGKGNNPHFNLKLSSGDGAIMPATWGEHPSQIRADKRQQLIAQDAESRRAARVDDPSFSYFILVSKGG